MFKLLTKKNCIECERVKKLISSRKLNISIEKAEDDTVDMLRQAGVRSFPVLIEERGEKQGFTVLESGSNTGYFINDNAEEFK